MKEEDIAKIAFAEIVRAVKQLKEELDGQYGGVQYPDSVTVDGNEYMFVKYADRSVPRGSYS